MDVIPTESKKALVFLFLAQLSGMRCVRFVKELLTKKKGVKIASILRSSLGVVFGRLVSRRFLHWFASGVGFARFAFGGGFVVSFRWFALCVGFGRHSN